MKNVKFEIDSSGNVAQVFFGGRGEIDVQALSRDVEKWALANIRVRLQEQIDQGFDPDTAKLIACIDHIEGAKV